MESKTNKKRRKDRQKRDATMRMYSRWMKIVFRNTLTAYNSTIIFFKKAAKHKNDVDVSNKWEMGA